MRPLARARGGRRPPPSRPARPRSSISRESSAPNSLDRGIRVNTLSPGPTDTAMFGRFPGEEQGDAVKGVLATNNPSKRMADPLEIAKLAVYRVGRFRVRRRGRLPDRRRGLGHFARGRLSFVPQRNSGPFLFPLRARDGSHRHGLPARRRDVRYGSGADVVLGCARRQFRARSGRHRRSRTAHAYRNRRPFTRDVRRRGNYGR